MFLRRSIFLAATAAALLTGCRTGILNGEEGPAQPPAPPAPVVVDGVRTSYADVVEKSAPAVVMIEAEGRSAPTTPGQSPFDDFFRQFPSPQNRQPQRGLGSGVIVSADGTILTNAHVIDGADKITVIFADRKTFQARLVGTDKPTDLAVLKIEAQDMPFLTLGNSDNVRIGDIVLAIGNPLGIGQTVTAGIISAKGRRTGLSDGSYEDFLQTDAPINRGNSGGALVSLNGELIGINSQILSGSPSGGNIGIGFSIPSNMAKSVMEQLLATGSVRRGMLGVNIQNVTEETAKALDLNNVTGVIVSNVRPGSAAEKAGIKRGDIITAINGERIEDSNVLRNKVAGTPPGTEIRLSILRDGSAQEMTATLEESDTGEARPGTPGSERQNAPSGESQNRRLGLSLQPITAEIARQFGLTAGEGLAVTEVEPGGAAASAGILPGDIVMEVNRRAVNSIESVQSALEGAGSRPVLLLINRRGQTIYVAVPLQ